MKAQKAQKPLELQAEIDAFNRMMCAKALLIAIEWAGGPRQLAESIGLYANSGHVWVRRGHIGETAALALSKLPDFPLTVSEMRPDVKTWAYHKDSLRKRQCPKCNYYFYPAKIKTASLDSMRAALKANRNKASSDL